MKSQHLNRTITLLKRAEIDLRLSIDAARAAQVSESRLARIRRIRREAVELSKELEEAKQKD